jgi:hypothetical protein
VQPLNFGTALDVAVRMFTSGTVGDEQEQLAKFYQNGGCDEKWKSTFNHTFLTKGFTFQFDLEPKLQDILNRREREIAAKAVIDAHYAKEELLSRKGKILLPCKCGTWVYPSVITSRKTFGCGKCGQEFAATITLNPKPLNKVHK